ncbi:MAG: class I SAM-dependent methyltransferase [Candidatus Bathyarchaeota archaeon]|nr:class I SAM-dependent methyltransferase [Candidatus Termiticorpusculum sp.]
MSNNIKKYIHGIMWLLRNPKQLQHIIIRETLYRNRNRSRQGWIEWQKYDTYTAAFQHSTAVSHARPLNQARIQTFLKMISVGGKNLNVLDVGCGDGVVSEPVAKQGNTVTGFDLPTITPMAHKRGISNVFSGDAENLAFKPEVFDVVLASEVVEHLWNPQSFLDDAYRVLKPKGLLILEAPEGIEGLRYDAHKNWFTVERFQHMLEGKFTLLQSKTYSPEWGAPTATFICLFQKN